MIGDLFGIYLFGCIVFVGSSSEESYILHILDIDETRQFTIEDIEEGLLKLHEARMGMDGIYHYFKNPSDSVRSASSYNANRCKAIELLEAIDTNDKCVDLLCSKLPNEKFTADEVKTKFKAVIFDILCKAREAFLKQREEYVLATYENIIKFVDSILQLRVIFADNLESNEISNYLYHNLMTQLDAIFTLYTNVVEDLAFTGLINSLACLNRDAITSKSEIIEFCEDYLNLDQSFVIQFIAERLNGFVEISTYLESIEYLFYGFEKYKNDILNLQANLIQADSYSIVEFRKYLRRLALQCKITLEDSYAKIYIMRAVICAKNNKFYSNAMKNSMKTFFISILGEFKDILFKYSSIIELFFNLQSNEELKNEIKFLINEVNSDSHKIIEEYEKSENMDDFNIGRINSAIIELYVVFDGLDDI